MNPSVMAELSPLPRLALRAAGVGLGLAYLAFVLYAATGVGDEAVFGIWIYCGVMVGAAVSCLLRAALVRQERAAWSLIGAGLLVWTGGEIYYEIALAASGSVPIPSPADAGYLLFYPLTYAGLIVLLRERIGSFPFNRWLDGLIAGVAVAALAAALALGPIAACQRQRVQLSKSPPTSPTRSPTSPCWRSSSAPPPSPAGARAATWSLLGAGLIVLAVSDVIYLLQSAQGTYVEGGLLDAAWPLGALLLAGAAWVPPPRPGAGCIRAA